MFNRWCLAVAGSGGGQWPRDIAVSPRATSRHETGSGARPRGWEAEQPPGASEGPLSPQNLREPLAEPPRPIREPGLPGSASPSQARRLRGRGGAIGETPEEGPPHRGREETGGQDCPPRAGTVATCCPGLRGKVSGHPEPPAAGGLQGRLPGPAGGIHGAAQGGPHGTAGAPGAGGGDGPATPARRGQDGFGLPGEAAALPIPEAEADAHQGADPGVRPRRPRQRRLLLRLRSGRPRRRGDGDPRGGPQGLGAGDWGRGVATLRGSAWCPPSCRTESKPAGSSCCWRRGSLGAPCPGGASWPRGPPGAAPGSPRGS